MSNWFITGVSTGLGKQLAIAAAQAGHTVVGTVRSDSAKAAYDALVPGRTIGLILDVTDLAAVAPALAQAEEITGGLDVVVNNAGVGYTGAIEETPIADAKALFDTNVWGAVAVIQAALPYLRARRSGQTVNIASVSGLACWHGTAIYGASKFALDCIGRTLAQEVGPLGITVTNVAPGGMRTEFAAAGIRGAAPTIADYAGTAHVARKVLTGHYGEEPSDTVLAARAILAALAQPEPPLELLLGKDAYGYATREFAMMLDQFETWKDYTLSTAAAPAEAH